MQYSVSIRVFCTYTVKPFEISKSYILFRKTFLVHRHKRPNKMPDPGSCQLPPPIMDTQTALRPEDMAATAMCPVISCVGSMYGISTCSMGDQRSKPRKSHQSHTYTPCAMISGTAYEQHCLSIHNETPQSPHMRPYGYWVCCQCDTVNDKRELVCTDRDCGHAVCYVCADFR